MSAPPTLPGRVRPWTAGDEASLVAHANSRAVWRSLRDRFPSPYTPADADRWLRAVTAEAAPLDWAIEVDGAAAGGIGLVPGIDVERVGAEIGYWLGESVWGRGLATAAVRAVTGHALFVLGFERVFAHVFHSNEASVRVLTKAGFETEGRLRRSAIKNGVVLDQIVLGAVRGAWTPGGEALPFVPAVVAGSD